MNADSEEKPEDQLAEEIANRLLAILSNKVDKPSNDLMKNNEFSRWRGQVITTLENLDKKQNTQQECLNDIKSEFREYRIESERRISTLETKLNVIGSAVAVLIPLIVGILTKIMIV